MRSDLERVRKETVPDQTRKMRRRRPKGIGRSALPLLGALLHAPLVHLGDDGGLGERAAPGRGGRGRRPVHQPI
jgi:hypothetical protein